MKIVKDVVYNVIELEDENKKSDEEIKKIVNFQWTKVILKYLEKVQLNG